HHDLSADASRDVEKSAHASAGAAVMRDRGFAGQGGVASPAKPRDRRRHGREGVRLVRELRDQETHGDSGLSGSPNNGDEVEALRKLRLRWVHCRGAKNPGACERRTDEKESALDESLPPR